MRQECDNYDNENVSKDIVEDNRNECLKKTKQKTNEDNWILVTKTLNDQEKYLLDSGASTHVVTSPEDLQNTRATTTRVTTANSQMVKATLMGDLRLRLSDNKLTIALRNILMCPDFKCNVIGLMKLIKDSNLSVWILSTKFRLHQNTDWQYVDIPRDHTNKDSAIYLTAERVLSPFHLKNVEEVHATFDPMFDRQLSLDINEAHEKLAHATERIVCATMNSLNVKVKGELSACDGCLQAKAKAKTTRKQTTLVATRPAERIHLDLTGPFAPSLGGNKYDAKLVDQYTKMSWLVHLKEKSQVAHALKKHLQTLTNQGFVDSYLRCDNAPEHMGKLQDICRKFRTHRIHYNH